MRIGGSNCRKIQIYQDLSSNRTCSFSFFCFYGTRSVPPPPPPLAPNSNGTPLPKKANSSSMSEGKVNGGANQENPRDAVFAQIRKKGFNLKHVEEDTQQVQPTIVNLPVVNPLISVLNTIREAKAPSESGSDHSNSWVSIENGHEQTEPEQAEKEQTKHTNPPLSKEEGSGGFDSGIGSRATSPLYSEQKTGESPVPPNSHVASAAKVNNVGPVNSEMQGPSTSSIKDFGKFFASRGGIPRPS